MNFGNIEGLVNGTDSVVFDYEVTGSAVSSISTGNILNGDEDGWYTIVLMRINTGTNTSALLRFNGDNTAGNYSIRGINATNTVVSEVTTTANNMGSAGTTGNTSFGIARVYAKSGAVRLINSMFMDYVSGTTVTSIQTSGNVWSNTADNIVSIQITESAANTSLGVGTRLIIIKSNNFVTGTPTGSITTPYIKGTWTRISNQVITDSAVTTVTFSNLDGDRDVLYRLSYATTNPLTNSNSYLIRMNADSGTNYGQQYLKGVNTTISAARNAAQSSISALFNERAGADSKYCGELLIFAKSGFIRPVISSNIDGVGGTTVTGIAIAGQVWDNTSDNISEITLSHAGTANQLGVGSQFALEALRPNG